jgi:hypothetical protein
MNTRSHPATVAGQQLEPQASGTRLEYQLSRPLYKIRNAEVGAQRATAAASAGDSSPKRKAGACSSELKEAA